MFFFLNFHTFSTYLARLCGTRYLSKLAEMGAKLRTVINTSSPTQSVKRLEPAGCRGGASDCERDWWRAVGGDDRNSAGDPSWEIDVQRLVEQASQAEYDATGREK